MVRIRKYANFIERFLHGEKGQRFFNIAYSIGAAVVIWGALFKILHLPGGNTLLCIGMGTEIAMFLLMAFDRPPKDYHWEDVFPVLEGRDAEDRPVQGGQPLFLSGGRGASVEAVDTKEGYSESLTVSMNEMAGQMKGVADQIVQLRKTTDALNKVSEVLLDSFRAISDNSELVSASSSGYVEGLEALNRNIGGLNAIYEIQLKSVSSQLENIDRVNRGLKDIRDVYEKSAAESSRYCEETERMSQYMRQLNRIYENLIAAMTVKD